MHNKYYIAPSVMIALLLAGCCCNKTRELTHLSKEKEEGKTLFPVASEGGSVYYSPQKNRWNVKSYRDPFHLEVVIHPLISGDNGEGEINTLYIIENQHKEHREIIGKEIDYVPLIVTYNDVDEQGKEVKKHYAATQPTHNEVFSIIPRDEGYDKIHISVYERDTFDENQVEELNKFIEKLNTSAPLKTEWDDIPLLGDLFSLGSALLNIFNSNDHLGEATIQIIHQKKDNDNEVLINVGLLRVGHCVFEVKAYSAEHNKLVLKEAGRLAKEINEIHKSLTKPANSSLSNYLDRIEKAVQNKNIHMLKAEIEKLPSILNENNLKMTSEFEALDDLLFQMN